MKTLDEPLQVARMYYHLNLKTEEIAEQLGLSRSRVSRLLSLAKEQGLVEFRIHDHRQQGLELERHIEQQYEVPRVLVVPVLPDASVAARTAKVTAFAAHYLNSIIQPGDIIGLAWGATISELATKLIPRPLPHMQVVQINGSGNSGHGFTYAAAIITAFAENYCARSSLLPIPAYFDHAETKEAMFRERLITRVRDEAARASIVLYSIGVPDAQSYIYSSGYLEQDNLRELHQEGVVGDIATMFFREDGTYRDIRINRRSSGPELASLRQHRHSICIVAGDKKCAAIRAALRGKFMKTLIVDSATARQLLGPE
ncbi:sugar-binding transcriptional regulator [Deinococcus sp. QL22]|uniref:sugar-binding transcriptional regulator n=1 Tax=Deinococcus sp. QL22 TaxID=2939437 RepID=UPI002017DDDF|nr:sugar-binding domain-containing protein [Deinococcus sp. QL22]UQN08238.1 MarR family transcriptional regulator [Deinococcus sp. QL22]